MTWKQLRGKNWRRMSRDVYVYTRLREDLELRIRAAGLVAPRGAVLSGATAAWLLGADFLRGQEVEVTVPPHSRARSRAGLTVRRSRLTHTDVLRLHGRPVTTPLRTAFDLARRPAPHGDLTEHVVAADALARRHAFAPEALTAFAAQPRLSGTRGVRRVAAVAEQCEPLAESPAESRLRMRIARAGLPRPTAQVKVYDRWGFFVARLDLAYEDLKLGVEYDGLLHRDRWAIDLARANRLRELGWELFTFTLDDLKPGVDTIPRQLAAALARRGGKVTDDGR